VTTSSLSMVQHKIFLKIEIWSESPSQSFTAHTTKSFHQRDTQFIFKKNWYIWTNTTQSPCLTIHKEPLSTNNLHLHFAKRARFIYPKSLIPSPPSFFGLHACSHFFRPIFRFYPSHKNFLSIRIVTLVLLSLFIMLIKKCHITFCLPHQFLYVKSHYFCNRKLTFGQKAMVSYFARIKFKLKKLSGLKTQNSCICDHSYVFFFLTVKHTSFHKTHNITKG